MSGINPDIDGWLINFFGYYCKTKTVEIDCIDVTIELDNRVTNIIRDVKLFGGFKAVTLEEGRIFRPHLSMAIIDGEPKKKEDVKKSEI